MKRGHDDGKMETMGEENKKGDFCPLFRLPRPACSGLAAAGDWRISYWGNRFRYGCLNLNIHFALTLVSFGLQ
ncbi:hypothetical protein P9726_14855 [Geobacillus stearothermophilus]|uniref:hypothetical protein n=1 Tax=Geobacillus stearothermophilus TaxID=1422 RepID=UPI0011C47670|nr:hypothetical protein [Geobacillus stearothermophilus]MED3765923.1 hypothetical protein [Geobacillus stearothermophilus]MED3774622.1 hypothetical protein [Geobacillus stearothermophilus]MED4870913.1 hypothetical protein [Geobacillus stearothermophilus]MED4980812.1 hypothetical protein [Geobacillus stearothermophilus]